MRTPALFLLAAIACAGPAPLPAPKAPPRCEAEGFLQTGAAEATAIATDAEGGMVVAGTFRGSIGSRGQVVESAGGEDVFVARRAPDGDLLWLRRLGGTTDDRAAAVLLTPDGDAVVAGGVGERCVVARFAPDGTQKWGTRLEGDGESICRALALAKDGAIWTAAAYRGTLKGGVASKGSTDVLVMRLAGDSGATTFSRTFGGKNSEIPRSIAVDGTGRVLIGGQFAGEGDVEFSQVDFGRGPVKSNGDYDAFLLQLGLDGKTEWAQTFGDTGDDDVNAVVPGPGGAIYVAGHMMPHADYRGIAASQVGNFIAYVAKFTRDGRREWLTTLPAQSSLANALSVDDQGRLWTAGTFKGEMKAIGVRSSPPGKYDGFVALIDPAKGTVLGGQSFGGPDTETVRALAPVPSGGMAIAASTRSQITPCGRPFGTDGQQTAFVLILRQ